MCAVNGVYVYVWNNVRKLEYKKSTKNKDATKIWISHIPGYNFLLKISVGSHRSRVESCSGIRYKERVRFSKIVRPIINNKSYCDCC